MEKVIRLTENDLSKIVKRVIIESVDYYDKIVSILEPPYFKNLISIGINENQYETILSKVFNQTVEKFLDSLYDEKGKVIYHETSDGDWYKYEYDNNDNETYYENSNGYWRKYGYDINGNNNYYEDSYGFKRGERNNNLNESTDDRYYDKIVSILELPYYQNLISMGIDEGHWGTIFSKLFNQPVRKDGVYFLDKNGNRIYGENSHGFWIKYEYNDNGNEIYREDSENGVVFDHRNNNLNESTDDRYYDKIVSILEKPYFQNLRSIGIDEYQWETILSKVFNKPVEKFHENLYDTNDNQIYSENSDGDWLRRKYDNNGNETYYENSYGGWKKREYDSNGNVVYIENSDGVWIKKEYDDNGNQIYYENSDGEIRDKRNNGNLNESTEDRYFDKLLSILQPPYFSNLNSMGIDENQYETILSKVYGYPVNVDYVGGDITNDSGNLIYYHEEPDGEWWKREYNTDGNVVYLKILKETGEKENTMKMDK